MIRATNVNIWLGWALQLRRIKRMENQESKFGFTQFAEIWNGRLAMLGFFSALGAEFFTGQGILSVLDLM